MALRLSFASWGVCVCVHVRVSVCACVCVRTRAGWGLRGGDGEQEGVLLSLPRIWFPHDSFQRDILLGLSCFKETPRGRAEMTDDASEGFQASRMEPPWSLPETG